MDYAFAGHEYFDRRPPGLLACRIDTVFEFSGLFFRQPFFDMYHFGSVADGRVNMSSIADTLNLAVQQSDFVAVLEVQPFPQNPLIARMSVSNRFQFIACQVKLPIKKFSGEFRVSDKDKSCIRQFPGFVFQRRLIV